MFLPKWRIVLPYSFYDGDPPPVDPSPAPKTFTQEQLDKILAKERRDFQTKMQAQATQLEELTKNFKGTEEEKLALQNQLEETQKQFMTKEQLAAQEADKAEKKRKAEVESLTSDRDTWQGRYKTKLISTEILSASAKVEAFSASQMQDLLGSKAKVIEKDGEHNVLIPMEVIDPKTKEKVKVELSVEEAMKQMKDQPEVYGNLFKSTMSGGTGSKGGGSGAKPLDVKNISTEEYIRRRKAGESPGI
jgi:hypothetical protein